MRRVEGSGGRVRATATGRVASGDPASGVAFLRWWRWRWGQDRRSESATRRSESGFSRDAVCAVGLLPRDCMSPWPMAQSHPPTHPGEPIW